MMLLMMLAGWINRHQQDMIEYLKEENKVLREKLGTKRLLLNDDQPDRRRKTIWKEFIQSHWQSLAACDFFTTEVYTVKGFTRYMVFVVIDYATRKVGIAGIVEQAYGDWMVQMARNLTDPFCGFLKNKKYLIHDRDPLYTQEFIKTLKAGGIKPIKSMPMAPNFSPFMFVRGDGRGDVDLKLEI